MSCAQVVKWLRAYATYATDPGSSPSWQTFAVYHTLLSPIISSLSIVNKGVYTRKKSLKKKEVICDLVLWQVWMNPFPGSYSVFSFMKIRIYHTLLPHYLMITLCTEWILRFVSSSLQAACFNAV